jgi:hypothetical protein
MSLASPSCLKFLSGGVAMFRHAARTTIAPIVRNAFLFALASALLLCSLRARRTLAAPQTVPVRDPQALNLIATSLNALTGTLSVNDATLQATASYVAGSDVENGTAILVGHVNQESIVQLNLSGGARQEVRNGPAGTWSGPDATAHSMANHNCLTDASWFFPALTLEAIAADPTFAVAYLGPDTSKGPTLLHLQAARILPGQSAGATELIQVLSTMDIYFDPKTSLPLVLDFNTHPDVDANQNLPVEIQFGSYQIANPPSGGLVPLHIQKYLQRTLLLDLTVSRVLVNSGVPASAFTLPAPTAGGAQ